MLEDELRRFREKQLLLQEKHAEEQASNKTTMTEALTGFAQAANAALGPSVPGAATDVGGELIELERNLKTAKDERHSKLSIVFHRGC